MKFRNLPSIISLISGFFVCIITLLNDYSIEESLWKLVIVIAIFYLIGLIIRKILNKAFEEKPISNEEEIDPLPDETETK